MVVSVRPGCVSESPCAFVWSAVRLPCLRGWGLCFRVVYLCVRCRCESCLRVLFGGDSVVLCCLCVLVCGCCVCVLLE